MSDVLLCRQLNPKLLEMFILPDDDVCNNQFGFREGRSTSMACNVLFDVITYYKALSSPLHII